MFIFASQMANDLTKEEFRQIREFLKETQTQFARRLGYKSWQTISYKENGTRSITDQDRMLLDKVIAAKKMHDAAFKKK